jgi:hypothetical protein
MNSLDRYFAALGSRPRGGEWERSDRRLARHERQFLPLPGRARALAACALTEASACRGDYPRWASAMERARDYRHGRAAPERHDYPNSLAVYYTVPWGPVDVPPLP